MAERPFLKEETPGLPTRIKRLFTRDMLTKTGVLILAIILWHVINEELLQERSFTQVRVRLVAPPDCVILGDTSPRLPEFVLRGPKARITGLPELLDRPQPPEIRLAVPANFSFGVIPVALAEEDLQLPVGVHFLGSPPQLQVELDQLQAVEIRLAARLDLSSLPAGYQVSKQQDGSLDVQIEPGRVKAEVPASLLARDPDPVLPTRPIPLRGQTDDCTLTIDRSLIGDTISRDGRDYPVRVQGGPVTVNVGVEPVGRLPFDLPVRLMLPADYPYRVVLEQAQVRVTLGGNPIQLRTLEERIRAGNEENIPVKVFVDVSGKRPGTWPLPVRFILPAGISVEDEELGPLQVEVLESTPSPTPEAGP